jgi:hypothetical protein
MGQRRCAENGQRTALSALNNEVFNISPEMPQGKQRALAARYRHRELRTLSFPESCCVVASQGCLSLSVNRMLSGATRPARSLSLFLAGPRLGWGRD